MGTIRMSRRTAGIPQDILDSLHLTPKAGERPASTRSCITPPSKRVPGQMPWLLQVTHGTLRRRRSHGDFKADLKRTQSDESGEKASDYLGERDAFTTKPRDPSFPGMTRV